MLGKAILSSLLGIFFGICFSFSAFAQCVVINEVMINPTGNNDGNNMPNTAEWLEIYNTCSTPVDISCYSIFDGDWSATIPSGTILGANDYFVIGSPNSGGPVDLNIATCNCTSGQSSQVGVFTNGNEQVGLLDASGTFVDGIYWGSGQFSNSNFTIAAFGSCAAHTVNVSASNPIWVQVSADQLNSDGSFLTRTCDGASTWQVLTSGSTLGVTNSAAAPVAAFTAASTSLCAGECTTFIDQSTGVPEEWEWTFSGSSTSSFTGQTPPSICYPNPGTYDVSLSIANGCGSDDLTLTGYITVSALPIPLISANGPLVICDNSSVQLSTTATGTLQWYANGAPIPGATSNAVTVNQTGSYTVTITNGICTQESEATDLLVLPVPAPQIISSNGSSICEGSSTVLSVSSSFTNYSWTWNGSPIGTSSNSLTASDAGVYQVEVSNDACNGTSPVFTLSVNPLPTVTLNPAAGVSICDGSTTTLQASGAFPFYTWRKNASILSGSAATLQVSEAGSYTVDATDVNGCIGSSNSVEVIVNIPEIPQIQAPADASLCEGENAVLTLTASFQTYSWHNANGLLPGANGGTYTAYQTGSYFVITTDANGCEGTSDPVVISVENTPVVTINPNGLVETCAVPFELTATSSAGAGLWHWFESGTPIPGANSATYAAIAEGVYTIEYTSNNGCVGVSEPTTLSIQTTFEAHIRSNIEEPCVGETVVLSLDGNYTNVLWSNGDSGNQLAILEGGDYTAFVTNNLGCTAVADTTIAFAPLPFIDAGEDIQYDCTGPALPLVESDGTSFLWTPNYNVSNDTLMIPELSPANTTRYTITATLGRCSSSDNVSVITDCSWIYIPTAFTPDFDGVNDAFKVVGHGISKFEITIFNRWGDPVYFSTDMDEAWVGGEGEYFVPDGVYTYKLIALDQYGVPILGDNASFGTIVVVR